MREHTVNPNAVTVESLIERLAGACDWAQEEDGVGFNKPDAPRGHMLAALTAEGAALDEDAAEHCLKMCRKYQRQLGGKGFMDEFLKKPNFRQPIIQDRYAGLIRRQGGKAIFKFRYNPDLQYALKQALRGFAPRFNGDVWEASLSTASMPLIEKFAKDHNFYIAANVYEDVPQGDAADQSQTNPLNVRLAGQTIQIRFPYDPALVGAVKDETKVGDARPTFNRNGNDPFWSIPLTPATLITVGDFAEVHSFAVAPDLAKMIADARRKGVEIPVVNDKKIISLPETKEVQIKFDYNEVLVAVVKNIQGSHRGHIYRSRFDGITKIWTVEVNESSIHQIVELAEMHGFDMDSRVADYWAKVQAKLIISGGCDVFLHDGMICVDSQGNTDFEAALQAALG